MPLDKFLHGTADMFISFIFAGSKVFCWDINTHEVVSSLECANIIPAVDSHKIQQSKKFEGKMCQKLSETLVKWKYEVV